MMVWRWAESRLTLAVSGGIWSAAGGDRWNVAVAVGVTTVAGLAVLATFVISSRRGGLKSPWSRRHRKHVLTLDQLKDLLTPNGKLQDGVKFLKKVRSGGVDPSVRPEVWPFLLGVYDLSSSSEERNEVRVRRRKEYRKLRRRCLQLLEPNDDKKGVKDMATDTNGEVSSSKPSDDKKEVKDMDVDTNKDVSSFEPKDDKKEAKYMDVNTNEGVSFFQPKDDKNEVKDMDVGSNEEVPSVEPNDDTKDMKNMNVTTNEEIPSVRDEPETGVTEEDPSVESSMFTDGENSNDVSKALHDASTVSTSSVVEEEKSCITHVDAPVPEERSSSDSEEELEGPHITRDSDPQYAEASLNTVASRKHKEDFATWQRIIRLDAVRANGDWIPYSPSQAAVSEGDAHRLAKEVGLKDYDHLEPCRVFHAARLVAVLEAYALYDPEIGYCQGMSDLLSPILAVMEQDYMAFWCFVGFMSKARHNFRLDEFGIRRQLNTVSKIIKYKDAHLYNHLEKLQAEDCFFVYRMVVVLFRRELTFEQTLCLWEVMWADQAAVRAGIGESTWGIIRIRAPPTEDLLLYAIAASVLQKRKLIIEKYYSMDEIMRECNSMTGQLDVWRLLDDAHDLVVTLHDKIE